jgi:hypothetical protein
MKLIIGLSILLVLVACGGTPTKSKAPNKITAQPDKANITYAERLGAELNKVMHSADATDPYTSREADLMDMTKDVRCEGNYKAVSVYDTQEQTENIYLILDRSDGLQIGRHIRFRFKLGTNDIIDTDVSSKTCLFIPTVENGMPYVSHLMSNEPTEFHVFLSLFHNKTVFVGTAGGAWKVESGKISKLAN